VVVEGCDGAVWWVGQVLSNEGGARDPRPSFCQVACVDIGVIHTLNSGDVVEILARGKRRPGQ